MKRKQERETNAKPRRRLWSNIHRGFRRKHNAVSILDLL